MGHWQRFWVGRTAILDLSDRGFLRDPEDEFVRVSPGAPATLAALQKFRALALLGEPGMGKSVSLVDEADRVRRNGDAAVSIYADLRSYSSESLLYHQILESPEFVAWKNGTSDLFLHLDSLDEALLRIDTIANLLAEELPKFPADRLSLRIACRTAVWPEQILEPALRSLWREEAVGVFELAPLRRLDVIQAAKERGIDEDRFIEAIFAANAVPFAFKPLTLNLLLALYQRDGRLPRSIVELYRAGCLHLCEEQNASRRGSRRVGALNPPQRLRLAGRLAAATMLANRYAIWTGLESGIVPPEDVLISEVAIDREEGDFQAFDVTQDAINEVLDTGLFSSRGPSRMGWAHQMYAEFLAASYLIEKGVSPKNILKLVLHPTGGLVPQLATVAAWAASLSKEVRDGLVALEPLALLRGDLASWSHEDLASLATALLRAYETEHVSDFVPGIANAYARLDFPGLAALLRPYVTDKGKNVVARRAAFMIAEVCKLKALQTELLHVALDVAEEPALRARAVAALKTCGDESVVGQLLPLAKGEAGPDPNSEMKGYALRLLWPGKISSAEMFATLTDSSDGFFGAYAMFLTYILPESLRVADLPDALRWATGFIAKTGYNGDFHRKRLTDAIFMTAWRHFDMPAVTDLFIEHIFTRLRHGGELLRGTDHRKHEAFAEELKADISRRRAFLLAAGKRRLEKIDLFGLSRSQLLRREDFQWLLGLRPGGASPAMDFDEATLCNMIETTADLTEGNFEALYEAAEQWEPLRRRYAWIFEGIPLDSPEAKHLRETHEMMRRLDEERLPPITPPPAERITACLEQCEGGDLSAWWNLNLQMTLTERQTHYGSDFDYFVTELPGWKAANEATRARILAAAETYLNDAKPEIEEWVGTTTFRRSDLSAFRALLLLRELRRDAYEGLPLAVWKKWAPVIVAVPTDDGADKASILEDIKGQASVNAPDEVADTIAKLICAERARANQQREQGQREELLTFFAIRRLDKGWDNTALKRAVFAELQSPQNSANQFKELLGPLLKAGFDPARDYAIDILKDETPERRAYTLAAAAELVSHCVAQAWPAVWKRVSADLGFGRELFLDLAHRYRFESNFLTELTELELGDLQMWLEQAFPSADDPQHRAGVAHWVGPRESLAEMRDSVVRHLVGRGTIAAVEILRRNAGLLPGVTWLPYQARQAEQIMRMKTWMPVTLAEFFAVIRRTKSRLVQSAEDLCEVLLEALAVYQGELHGEQNPIRDLWDRQPDGSLRPVEEDALSDHVTRFLKRELGANGIISNREVEVGRVLGARLGRRTDIKIDAVRIAEDGTRYDRITGVIETKGCWNPELFTAMEAQLHRDYLVPLAAPVGIYLVGWFDKPNWDDTDRRKGQTPDETLDEIQRRLDTQAASLSDGYLVRAVALDCHAP
jgi:hypothetical protein